MGEDDSRIRVSVNTEEFSRVLGQLKYMYLRSDCQEYRAINLPTELIRKVLIQTTFSI